MENALKGKNNGGQVTLGYRTGADGVLEIDPKTAPMVKEIFQRYDDGELMKDIVDSLNSRGLLTAAGKPFRIASLGTVLKNRKYLGEYHYGTICIPDKLPVIIEKDQFERVQQRMGTGLPAPKLPAVMKLRNGSLTLLNRNLFVRLAPRDPACYDFSSG